MTGIANLEIPEPRVNGWAVIEGTRTTFADPVPTQVHRRPHDANSADVVVAYPVTFSRGPGAPPPDQRFTVRLDFLEVYRFEFRGFYLPAVDHGAVPFCLSVSDDSAFIGETVGHRDTVPADGPELPTSSLRHCHLSFDDYGSLDIVCARVEGRRFPTPGSLVGDWDYDVPGEADLRHRLLSTAAAELGSP